jgi:hypothetical protein
LNHSREGEKKEKYQKEVMHPVDYWQIWMLE